VKNDTFREKLHTIIFESETPAGRAFDLTLIGAIVASVGAVILESEPAIKAQYGTELYFLEWFFTILFLCEYFLRIYAIQKPMRYVFSFYGLIDLASCLPTLLSYAFPGAQSLLVIRSLRLLRIFRILKLGTYFDEGLVIVNALKAARAKIFVFFFTIVLIVIIAGATMHFIEGPESGFVSISSGMYWAVVTLTTVGYGDIAPATTVGRFIASAIMILGYAIIAVPTGIITSELNRKNIRVLYNEACPGCGAQGHEPDALYCHRCGTHLELKKHI
jgi:voltage-gated potassium channel